MKKAYAFLLFLAICFFPQIGISADAETTVTEFYKFHFVHDMGFTRDSVQKRSAWLSPGLIEECRKYFAVPEDPNEIPNIDGDPFTDSQEYPQSFLVGTATVSGQTARVPVTMVWREGNRRPVTIVLKLIAGKWMIDDVEYPGDETLRGMLKSQ